MSNANPERENLPGSDQASAPSNCSVKWLDIGYGGVKAEHDAGDYDGAIVTTAQVVQGGNNLWTPWVHQVTKGRRHKNITTKRIHGTTVSMYYPGQVATHEEAIALCERKWYELLSPNAPGERLPGQPKM